MKSSIYKKTFKSDWVPLTADCFTSICEVKSTGDQPQCSSYLFHLMGGERSVIVFKESIQRNWEKRISTGGKGTSDLVDRRYAGKRNTFIVLWKGWQEVQS